MTTKGIIFDMDNTLLRSRINFGAMKQEIYEFLLELAVLPYELMLENETTSTLIRSALMTKRMDENAVAKTWEIAKKHEVAGMIGADLEDGVRDLLKQLQGGIRLAIVTNNSYAAAEAALRDNQIGHFFDVIAGREQMHHLKPAPDGYFYVLNYFNDLTPGEWLSVGDSWIDCKASHAAGIRFVAYRPDLAKWGEAGVNSDAIINHINELLDYLQ